MTDALKAWLVDTGERAGSTFVQAFLGVFGVQGLIAVTGGNWHAVAILARSAEVAGLAAALAVVKAALAGRANGTVSPASLAPAQQPGQAEQDAPPSPSKHVSKAGGALVPKARHRR